MKLKLYKVAHNPSWPPDRRMLVVAAQTADDATRVIQADHAAGDWQKPELIGQSVVSNKMPSFIVLHGVEARD